MKDVYKELLACLPLPLRREIARMQQTNADFFSRLEEIRLRAGHRVALTLDGRNLLLPLSLTEGEVSSAFEALCDGSVYAHAESLRAGYISRFGLRIGVAGRVVVALSPARSIGVLACTAAPVVFTVTMRPP